MTPFSSTSLASLQPHTSVEMIDRLSPADLFDLCDATDTAIEGGGGFGWVTPPSRDVLERYWKGVMTVPERHLIVARLDGIICGAAQIVEPVRHNEAQSFSCTMLANFVAPWARGHGAGRRLVETAEKLAYELGYKILQFDVRETQTTAIRLYQSMGYKEWGRNPNYAMVDNHFIAGIFFSKIIRPLFVPQQV